jgi:hypothetical protein
LRETAACRRFCEESTEVEAVKLFDMILIVVVPESMQYGIELLNASEQFKANGAGHLLIEPGGGENA